MTKEELIKKYLKKMRVPEHELINPLKFDIALNELVDEAQAEGRQEFICKNCADIWNVDTSDEYEAGRQSALNEIEKLENMLNSSENDLAIIEDENKKLKQQLVEKDKELSKLRDGVVKLVETKINRFTGDNLDGFVDGLFPSCAEQLVCKHCGMSKDRHDIIVIDGVETYFCEMLINTKFEPSPKAEKIKM